MSVEVSHRPAGNTTREIPILKQSAAFSWFSSNDIAKAKEFYGQTLGMHLVRHGIQQFSEAALLLTTAGRSPGDLGFPQFVEATGRRDS